MLDMVDNLCLHFSAYHQVKHSRIDASIFKRKANALDSVHPLCRNLIVDFQCLLQCQIVMELSHHRKLCTLCHIKADVRFRRRLLCRQLFFHRFCPLCFCTVGLFLKIFSANHTALRNAVSVFCQNFFHHFLHGSVLVCFNNATVHYCEVLTI